MSGSGSGSGSGSAGRGGASSRRCFGCRFGLRCRSSSVQVFGRGSRNNRMRDRSGL